MSGNLNMGGNTIRGLSATYPPIFEGDEAVSWHQVVGLVQDFVGGLPTKDYIDSAVGDCASKSGGQITGNLNMRGNKVLGWLTQKVIVMLLTKDTLTLK